MVAKAIITQISGAEFLDFEGINVLLFLLMKEIIMEVKKETDK